MPDGPRICVYGAGAVGGFIAALLSEAGCAVSVVARGPALAAIEADGLRLRMTERTVAVRVRASAEPSALGPQDYVVIAVKTPALAAIAPRIAPLLGRDTAVMTAMNGVPWWFFGGNGGPNNGPPLVSIDPEGRIARLIPPERVIGCVVHVTCSRDAPGVIRHGFGNDLIIGEAGRPNGERVATLGAWLDRAGFRTTISPQIRHDVWIKLWGNLSVNPISLLTGATTDRIIGDPLIERLCVRMMEETGAIGGRIGIPISLSPQERLGMARKLGGFKTSMLQDMENGRPVEIDALLTAVQEIAGRVGVATPFIDAVLGLSRLRARELGLYPRDSPVND